MVKLYVKRINEGKLILDDVPEYWREYVADALFEQDIVYEDGGIE